MAKCHHGADLSWGRRRIFACLLVLLSGWFADACCGAEAPAGPSAATTDQGDGAFREALGYFTGESGWVDFKSAMERAKVIAEQGDPRGKWMYAAFQSMAGDDAQADRLRAESREALRQLADRGDPYALSIVSSRFFTEDNEKSITLLRKSAQAGFAQGQHWLAMELTSQLRAPQKEREAWEEAIGWLKRAAEQGHVPAARDLARCYAQGLGVGVDLEAAWKWYKVAAERGGGVPFYYYWSSHWVPLKRDHRRAMELCEAGLARNDPEYEHTLARVYEQEPIADLDRARFYYEKAGANEGPWPLIWFLVRKRPADYKEAGELLSKALAEQRLPADPDAIVRWGPGGPVRASGVVAQICDAKCLKAYLLLTGLGGQKNEKEAVALLGEALSDPGDVSPREVFPQLLLAYCYATGRGVGKDMDRAAALFGRPFENGIKQGTWSVQADSIIESIHFYAPGVFPELGLRRAEIEPMLRDLCEPLAEKGLARAQLVLGYLLETDPAGSGGDETAMKWYSKAAEQGLSEAQVRLALRYLHRADAPRSRAEADAWLHRAAAREGDKAWVGYAQALLHYHGLGVQADQREAARILDSIRQQPFHCPPALFMLGKMYEAGEAGLAKDPTEALRLFEDASWQIPEAAMRAAECWNKGIGCERNIYEAADYYHIAVVLIRNKEAEQKLGELRAEYRKMYPDE